MTNLTYEQKQELEELAKTISSLVNGKRNLIEPLLEKIANEEHRTLQQSFTRLCFAWIDKIASDDYLTDGRNERSKQVAKALIAGSQDITYGLPLEKTLPFI